LAYQSWGKAIDIGNACDVDFVDALEYLGDDPETKVIVFHMEGVLRGRNSWRWRHGCRSRSRSWS